MVPTTGPLTQYGDMVKEGVNTAVEMANAAGGVNGKKIELVSVDDACEPKQGPVAANRVVNAKIGYVIGPVCSGASIAAAPIYNNEGVVVVTPSATSPALTDGKNYHFIFRTIGRDDQQGEVAGAYIAEHFGDKNVAILNDKSAYGKGLADETQAALEAAGKKPSLVEAYTAGEKDYTALVSKMKQADIGLVYIGGYHTEAGLIARQMKEQGVTAVIMSGDAIVTDEYWAITGDAGEGTLMTFSPDPRKNPIAEPVVKEIEAEGKSAEGYALYTYAAIQAWADAVKAAGSTDYEPVVEALDSGDFSTVIGDLKFDDKGDVTLPGYVVYEWKNGAYDYVETASAQ